MACHEFSRVVTSQGKQSRVQDLTDIPYFIKMRVIKGCVHVLDSIFPRSLLCFCSAKLTESLKFNKWWARIAF